MRWKGRSRTKVILFLSFSSDSPPLSIWGHSTDFCVFVFVGFFFFPHMASIHSESVFEWQDYYFHNKTEVGPPAPWVTGDLDSNPASALSWPPTSPLPPFGPGFCVCKKQESGSTLPSLPALPPCPVITPTLSLENGARTLDPKKPSCNG